ncbi:hypothetical protein QQF73_13085 [Marinobacter sp. M216]|uniref:Uncharacterized protein n=1 Tax=Marinobacter albus TaxID=3030833 RepID=A0ABT7HGA5_9GAMM|nr:MULTISPECIES: hypothetical protein [unclassified Marinobacter]MBW7471991.1 hypothetical protein [Marinobacter sp. F4218]MDK9558561.1 hypothetical protein [Marinobacter sp. M216]
MAHLRASENKVRLCLTTVMALVVLAWATSGFNVPALDPQLEEPGSFQVTMLDASGDSPSGEAGLTGSLGPGLPLITGYPGHSPNLSFIEPPVRLVSYPALPQGPPSLT